MTVDTMSTNRWSRPASLRSFTLGYDEIRVSYVPDGASALLPTAFFPASDNAIWRDHPEYLDESGALVASLGGLLVERGSRALLIDAGMGPTAFDAMPPAVGPSAGGELLANLHLLGRSSADIEAVAFTHLHPDHIGWASPGSGMVDGTPFIDAEWLISAADEGPARTPGTLIEADERLRTVVDGQEIFPGVTVMATPGHSPGHLSYVIDGGSARMIVTGDVMHSFAQVRHPNWNSWFDADPVTAESTRRKLIRELTTDGTIGICGHFADVVFGHADSAGSHVAWHPVSPDITEL